MKQVFPRGIGNMVHLFLPLHAVEASFTVHTIRIQPKAITRQCPVNVPQAAPGKFQISTLFFLV